MYLSKKSVGEYFAVTPRTVDVWVASGKFPKRERAPNGRPRWHETTVKAAMSGNRSTAA